MYKVNKPNYKWFERWWVLLLFVLLAPFTIGTSLFFFGISGLLRARTLYLHQKSQKNKIVANQQVVSRETEITTSSSASAYQPSSFSEHQDALRYSKVRKLVPDYTVLDFETTGLNPDEHEIIQFSAVKYRNHEKVDEYCTYIHAIESISSEITKINGITNEDVENAPRIHNELPKLIDFIGNDLIVAHNAPFDMKFLLTNIYEYKMSYKKFRVIDTLTLSRKYITSTKNHKLVTLKKYLGLSQLKSHDALHDCYVAAELYKYCYEKAHEE